MPAVLTLALFSIPQTIMPFTMNFHAFVKAFFMLASLVALVWGFLFQLIENTLLNFFDPVMHKLVEMIIGLLIQVWRKPVEIKTDQQGGETFAQDRNVAETAASSSNEGLWILRLGRKFQFGKRRTRIEEGEAV